MTVTGPVTGGVHGWAFGGPGTDLSRQGYRQDEYFLEGTAVRYSLAPGTQLTADGRWHVEPTEPAAFKTRLVVVRPEDPSRFSGTVLLLWNNVSAGYDNFAGGDSPETYDKGHAFVAVSAQRAGVHGVADDPQGLRAWDPQRYNSLCIPSDDYSYDIFSQAAGAVGPARNRSGIDPMGRLEVRRVIAQGASQSAARLATYVNAIQPAVRLIDGFLITLYFGTGAPLEVGDAVVTVPRPGAEQQSLDPMLTGSHRLRDDLGVPIMVVNSECEAQGYFVARQPDSESFRYWEVAGTSHLSRQALASSSPRSERDFGFSVPDLPEINHVPMNPVMDAALYHLAAWVAGGPPPPAQPRIEFAGNPPAIVRDEHGIARGGIRLPQVEVPVAHNSAIARTPDVWSRLAGCSEPFSAAKLRALYGDSTAYMARFEEATRAAQHRGAILARDADGLIAEARRDPAVEPLRHAGSS